MALCSTTLALCILLSIGSYSSPHRIHSKRYSRKYQPCTVEFRKVQLPEKLMNYRSVDHPENCSSYKASEEFIPKTNTDERFNYVYSGEPSVCKAILQGVEHFGVEFSGNVCWVWIGGNLVSIKDYWVLRNPMNVRLVWKTGSEENLNTLAVKVDAEKRISVGRAFFQPYQMIRRDNEKNITMCVRNRGGREVTVLGIISDDNPTVLQFQHDRELYETSDFQVLTCQDF